MTKFITPVAMPCNKEQYEKALRDPLLKMGYKEYQFTWNLSILPTYLCTNIDDEHNQVSDLRILYKDNNRYFIDHYNPELFLALAGMREDKEIKVGDWVRVRSRIGQVKGYGAPDGFGPHPVEIPSSKYDEPIKATKEEIIEHFYQKVVPEASKPDLPTIFKADDTIYHWKYGKGKVISVYDKHSRYDVVFNGSRYQIREDELSFTPYNLVDGGLSQERPKPEIKPGTTAFFWDESDTNTLKYAVCSKYKEKAKDGRHTDCCGTSWTFASLENPFK